MRDIASRQQVERQAVPLGLHPYPRQTTKQGLTTEVGALFR